MIGYYDLANSVTYLGVAFAVIGMHMAVNQHTGSAVICLIMAGICDMFDGPLARRTPRSKQEQHFGIELDSLADVISFGVFPALIGYSAGMNTTAHVLLHVMYVLAALIRLAYFNVSETERKERESGPRTCYEGLPVTSIAILLPLMYLISQSISLSFSAMCTVLLPLVAVAFVSRVRVHKPKPQYLLAVLILGAIVIKTILVGKGYYFG